MVEAEKTRLGTLQVGIILLTLATAFIHWYVAIQDPPIRLLFTINGLGYLGLLALHYLPLPMLLEHRRLTRWLLFGYTLIPLVGFIIWFVMNRQPDVLGFVDKVIEIALLWLLWREDGEEREQDAALSGRGANARMG